MKNESYSGNGNVVEQGSTDSNVVEQGEQAVYKCARCPRVFKSGQALGGHQNAHRRKLILRPHKGKQLGNLHPVLLTALTHQVPDDESVSSNLPNTNARVEENNVVESKPKVNIGSPSSSQYHPHKKLQQELPTVDYLTGWTSNVDDRAASPSTGNPSAARLSTNKSEHLNLELQLSSGYPNRPDLELKPGL